MIIKDAIFDQISFVVEQLPYGLLIENSERKIHSVNNALIDIFDLNLKPQDLKGFDCELLANEVGNAFINKEFFFEVIQQCIGQKTKQGPFPFALHSGKHVELTYIPYFNANNVFFGHSWCYTNITSLKETEIKFENQTKFFRNILDAIPADIALFSPKHEYLFINKMAIKNPELREWMIGKKDEDYCFYKNKPVSIAKERRTKFNEAIITKKSVEWEDHIPNQEGKDDFVLRVMQPYLDKNDEVEFVVGYGLNVTEFKAKTLQLKEQVNKNMYLQGYMKGIVFSADKNLIITNVNPAWQTVTGYKFLVNKKTKILDYIGDEEIKSQIQLFLTDSLKTELQVRFQFKVAKSNLRWVEGFIFRHYPNVYDNSFVWGILNDIDDKIRSEENLVNQIIKEKELNELKSRFVNMVSHEVRTPLAGILSSVELLEIINHNTLHELKEKNNRHFGRIKDQISKIGELMNDVLLLGKIESGTVEVKLVEINLVTKIKDFLNENFDPESSNRKIVFKVKGQNKNISLDWKLMYHVFTNLISNALKYSVGKPDPEIELIFRKDDLSIFIKDYGIGIPKKDINTLFVPFIRGSNVAGINGTGLGLVLVKYFVEMHNGTIHLMSELEQGTNIEITLKY